MMSRYPHQLFLEDLLYYLEEQILSLNNAKVTIPKSSWCDHRIVYLIAEGGVNPSPFSSILIGTSKYLGSLKAVCFLKDFL